MASVAGAMDETSMPIESPIQWFRIAVVGAVVAVIIHLELPRFVLDFVRETLWTPWRVTRQMRKQGHSGPSLGLFKDHAKELRELTMKAPTDPLMTSSGLNHDLEARLFPNTYEWRTLYGNDFIFKRGTKVHLHACDPDVLKDILATKFDQYEKCGAVALSYDVIGSQGLVFAEHEEWARQRRVVRPAFYAGRTKEKVDDMASWIEVWLQNLDDRLVEQGGSLNVEMKTEFNDLTKDLLARTAFGSSFQRGKEGIEHLEKHKNLLLKRGQIWNPLVRWIPTAQNKAISKEKGEVLTCLREIIRERRKSIKSGSYETYGDDFLGLLLADRDRRLALRGRPPGELETEDDHLTDQCRTFFFAGADTIHGVLLWAVVLLSFYSDWQDRIRAEVQEAFEGGLPNGTNLNKLKLLKIFMDETLRLYGPVPHVTRAVYMSDTTLLGEPLPKDLAIMINYFALHRNKEMWGDDALEFKPERFSNGIAQACKNPIAYSPFGVGPRTCVAQSFALAEGKLILAMLVQRFSFRLSPSYLHEPMMGMTLMPKFGVQVVLEQVTPRSGVK